MEQHCYGLSLVIDLSQVNKQCSSFCSTIPSVHFWQQHRVTIKAFSWLPLFAAGYSSHGGFGQLLRSHVQVANGWSQLASPGRRGPKGDLEGLPIWECGVYVHQKLLARQSEIYLPAFLGWCWHSCGPSFACNIKIYRYTYQAITTVKSVMVCCAVSSESTGSIMYQQQV